MSSSRNYHLLYLLAVGFAVGPVNAQVIDTTSVEPLERVLESIDAEDADADQIVELLSALLDNPLDINAAKRDELAQVPAIGPTLAQAIIEYRTANGFFTSMPELQLVPGLTEDIFLEVRPFLTIGEQREVRERRPSRFGSSPGLRTIVSGLRVEAIQRMTRRLDIGRGYDGDTTATQYIGSPERIYTRLRATFGRQVSVNVTAEKDPGERLRWSPTDGTYGYDHVAGHVAIRDFGRIDALIVGDYVASFGQGLVLWRGLSAGKGREVVSPIVRTGNGVQPYGSTEENLFFRGGALGFAVAPNVVVTVMASQRSLDATVSAVDTSDGLDALEVITSLGTTGLHRTPSELSRRDKIEESLLGGAVEWTSRNHRLGVVGYRSRFNIPVVAGDQAYERFRFAGDEAMVGSVFASFFMGDYVLFGEAATDQDGAVAAIAGVSANLGRTVRAVVSTRSYSRGFTNLHSYAFGESSGSTQNERGMYLGVQIRPNTRWRFAGFVDQYRFPWARFAVPRPSTGYEALGLVEHRPRRWILWYIQGRTETKAGGYRLQTPTLTELDALRDETRQSVRGHLQYEFSKRMTTRTRVEGIRFKSGGDDAGYGMLIYQDVQIALQSKLRLDTRIMLFDTDGFDARVFAYEYDLRYTFAVPAFSGQGQRMYAMLTYAPSRSFALQLKYGVTRYEHVETVGSGLDETEGNTLREVRAQLIWRP